MFRCLPREEKEVSVESIIAKLKEISQETFSEDELAEIAKFNSPDEAKLKKAILDRIPRGESEIPFIFKLCAVKTSKIEADIHVDMVERILSLRSGMINLLDPGSDPDNKPFDSARKIVSNAKLIEFLKKKRVEEDSRNEIFTKALNTADLKAKEPKSGTKQHHRPRSDVEFNKEKVAALKKM